MDNWHYEIFHTQTDNLLQTNSKVLNDQGQKRMCM